MHVLFTWYNVHCILAPPLFVSPLSIDLCHCWATFLCLPTMSYCGWCDSGISAFALVTYFLFVLYFAGFFALHSLVSDLVLYKIASQNVLQHSDMCIYTEFLLWNCKMTMLNFLCLTCISLKHFETLSSIFSIVANVGPEWDRCKLTKDLQIWQSGA